MDLKPGDKVYYNNRGKSIMLAVIGSESLNWGANICAAHVDSPRMDLKPNPLYEDSEMAYFKTHYYGGIKKYQWTTIPLAIHGVVAKKDGSVIIGRYTADGLHELKAEGVKNEERGDIMDADPTVYESWRVVTATDDRKYED